jgi:hypothetical protein
LKTANEKAQRSRRIPAKYNPNRFFPLRASARKSQASNPELGLQPGLLTTEIFSLAMETARKSLRFYAYLSLKTQPIRKC